MSNLCPHESSSISCISPFLFAGQKVLARWEIFNLVCAPPKNPSFYLSCRRRQIWKLRGINFGEGGFPSLVASPPLRQSLESHIFLVSFLFFLPICLGFLSNLLKCMREADAIFPQIERWLRTSIFFWGGECSGSPTRKKIWEGKNFPTEVVASHERGGYKFINIFFLTPLLFLTGERDSEREIMKMERKGSN